MPPATASACSIAWSPTITNSNPWSGIARNGDARIRLAAARAPAKLPRLAVEDAQFVGDQWRTYHADAPAPAAFDLASRGPMPIRLAGPGLIWSGETLLDDNATMPIYVRPELDRPGSTILATAQALPIRRDRRPALVFHGWGVQVYGHLLIEMLPKLLLAARFPALFAAALPVLDRQMSPWLIDIIQTHCGIAPDRAIWFDSATEQLALDHAVILPLLTRAGGYHPLTNTLIDAFIARTATPNPDPARRLFVARGAFTNPAAPRRRLANEAELAAIAAESFGFSIIHPETMTFADQVSHFSQARTIIGQSGSGLHNTLFAPEGATTGVIRFMAPDQSAIAALRRQRIAYLTEAVTEIEPGIFHADPTRFTRFIENLLAQP